MERFIHRQNIRHFRRLLEETNEEAKRKIILQLLAQEEAKEDPLAAQRSASPSAQRQAPQQGEDKKG